jgi:hypothetical protein
MGLFGDEIVKFFLRDDTIAVRVSSLDHFLKNGIVSEFTEILGNFSKILKSDEAYLEHFIPVFWIS